MMNFVREYEGHALGDDITFGKGVDDPRWVLYWPCIQPKSRKRKMGMRKSYERSA